MRSREAGRDFVPRISTRRLNRGRASSVDLEIRQYAFWACQHHNYSFVVLTRLLARGLVLIGAGASVPRRCTISGTSTKMLESKPLVDDCHNPVN